ncbi:MAG: hypothetical protein WDW36_003247 [Sanguina aurantia]
MTDAQGSSGGVDSSVRQESASGDSSSRAAARQQSSQPAKSQPAPESRSEAPTSMDGGSNTSGNPAAGPNPGSVRPPRRRQPHPTRGSDQPGLPPAFHPAAHNTTTTNGDTTSYATPSHHQPSGHPVSAGALPPSGSRPNSRRAIRDPSSLAAAPMPTHTAHEHPAVSDHPQATQQQQQQQPPVDRFASSRYEYQRPSLPRPQGQAQNPGSNPQNHITQAQASNDGGASYSESHAPHTNGGSTIHQGSRRGQPQPRQQQAPNRQQQQQQRGPHLQQQQQQPRPLHDQQQGQSQQQSQQQQQQQAGSSGPGSQSHQRPVRPRSGAAANGGAQTPNDSPRQQQDRSRHSTHGQRGDTRSSTSAPSSDGALPPANKPAPHRHTPSPPPPPSFTCLICCEPSHAIAIGKCGHTDVCAMCTLRLRLLYADNRCSLCKGQNDEVVIISAPGVLPAPDTAAADAAAAAAAAAAGPTSKATDAAAALPASAVATAALPSFESLVAQRSRLWQKPGWAKGVLVDDASGVAAGAAAAAGDGGVRQERILPQDLLHSRIVAATTRSCSICSERGYSKLFPSDKQMQDHLQASHGMQCCSICLTAGRRFPLELPPLSPAALRGHVRSAHECCAFCSLDLYGKDELYAHMTQHHFTCHVCQRLGAQHLYFQDADMLAVHLATQHFLCSEQECNGCFIAFATEDELRAHCTQRHSAHMPRWDQSRARPLIFDFVTPAARALAISASRGSDSNPRGATAPNPNSTRSRRRGTEALNAAATVSAMAAAAASAAAAATAAAATHSRGLGENYESADGMGMIDDDLGSFAAAAAGAAELAAVAANDAYGAASREMTSRELTGAWASRASGPVEEFPSLQAAAAAPVQSFPPSASALAQASWTRPVLRKATLRCPCGRIVAHLGLREGEEVSARLACDCWRCPPVCNRECATAARRGQLASAFGVEDAGSHMSSFERHRTPAYSAKLQEAALDRKEWVEGLESEFTSFLMDASKKRHSLAPMPASRRALVHELAEAYGLTSHSTGQEPNKCVQVFKTPQSGTPSKGVVAVAHATGREGLSSIQGPARPIFSLKLVDLQPDVNLQFYLRTWAGDYELAWQSSSTALVTFNNATTFKSASDNLAGGIRGIFRVDRSTPQQNAPAAAAAAAAAAATGWAGVPAPAPPGWQVWSKGKSKGKAPAGGGADGTASAAPNGGGDSPGNSGNRVGRFVVPGASKAAPGAGGPSAVPPAADPWDDSEVKPPPAPWRRSGGRPQPSQPSAAASWKADAGRDGDGELPPSGPALVPRPLAVPADWSDSEDGEGEEPASSVAAEAVE